MPGKLNKYTVYSKIHPEIEYNTNCLKTGMSKKMYQLLFTSVHLLT